MGLEAAPLSREQTLHIALGMGKALLKNGAETSRVEDTISRFCHTHGYHDIHVFVTPTVIILGGCYDYQPYPLSQHQFERYQCGERFFL